MSDRDSSTSVSSAPDLSPRTSSVIVIPAPNLSSTTSSVIITSTPDSYAVRSESCEIPIRDEENAAGSPTEIAETPSNTLTETLDLTTSRDDSTSADSATPAKPIDLTSNTSGTNQIKSNRTQTNKNSAVLISAYQSGPYHVQANADFAPRDMGPSYTQANTISAAPILSYQMEHEVRKNADSESSQTGPFTALFQKCSNHLPQNANVAVPAQTGPKHQHLDANSAASFQTGPSTALFQKCSNHPPQNANFAVPVQMGPKDQHLDANSAASFQTGSNHQNSNANSTVLFQTGSKYQHTNSNFVEPFQMGPNHQHSNSNFVLSFQMGPTQQMNANSVAPSSSHLTDPYYMPTITNSAIINQTGGYQTRMHVNSTVPDPQVQPSKTHVGSNPSAGSYQMLMNSNPSLPICSLPTEPNTVPAHVNPVTSIPPNQLCQNSTHANTNSAASSSSLGLTWKNSKTVMELIFSNPFQHTTNPGGMSTGSVEPSFVNSAQVSQGNLNIFKKPAIPNAQNKNPLNSTQAPLKFPLGMDSEVASSSSQTGLSDSHTCPPSPQTTQSISQGTQKFFGNLSPPSMHPANCHATCTQASFINSVQAPVSSQTDQSIKKTTGVAGKNNNLSNVMHLPPKMPRLEASLLGSQAGPSGSQTGSSDSQAGPSGSRADPSGSHAGSSGSHADPSCSQAGPSGSQAGPSSSHASPSGSQASSFGSQADPSSSSVHPTFTLAAVQKAFENLSRYKYKEQIVEDTAHVAGMSQPVFGVMKSITVQPEFSDYSFEELRYCQTQKWYTPKNIGSDAEAVPALVLTPVEELLSKYKPYVAKFKFVRYSTLASWLAEININESAVLAAAMVYEEPLNKVWRRLELLLLLKAITYIDLSALNGDDTSSTIAMLVNKAFQPLPTYCAARAFKCGKTLWKHLKIAKVDLGHDLAKKLIKRDDGKYVIDDSNTYRFVSSKYDWSLEEFFELYNIKMVFRFQELLSMDISFEAKQDAFVNRFRCAGICVYPKFVTTVVSHIKKKQLSSTLDTVCTEKEIVPVTKQDKQEILETPGYNPRKRRTPPADTDESGSEAESEPESIKCELPINSGRGIKIVAAAAGFPSGQYTIDSKKAEISEAIKNGAQEIDIVISRNLVLQNDWQKLYTELKVLRNCCEGVIMKTILSVGECGSLKNIYDASMVAMAAGSDFIKTSTGKEEINATFPAALIMCRAIRNYYGITGRKVGFKPAGGIRSADDILRWMRFFATELGEEWSNNFRIGASGVLQSIENRLWNIPSGY